MDKVVIDSVITFGVRICNVVDTKIENKLLEGVHGTLLLLT